MRIQFTKEARKLYTDVCSELSGRSKAKFKIGIENIFDAKITSMVDLPEFRITRQDILELALTIKEFNK